jgi:hypothetical protein
MYLRGASKWAVAFCLLGIGACGDSNDGGEPTPSVTNPSEDSPGKVNTPVTPIQAGAAGSGANLPGANSGAQPPASMNPTTTPASMNPSTMPPAGSAMNTPGAASGDVTYHKQIRPMLESNCLSCHVAGGIGPFPLDNWASVKMVAGPVVNAVKMRIMPPWPAAADCQPIRDTRSLSDADIALFTQWQTANFPEGDPKDYVAPPAAATQADIGPPTLELSGGMKYTPPVNADDYHCFLTSHTFEQDTYLTAIDIVPDQRAEVHHVQVHRITAQQLAQLQSTDSASPASGYPCNSGLVLSQNMFSWRPGGDRVTFDKGDAAYIQAGSSIMLQVHYNTVFLPAEQPPTPDQTKVSLWTLPAGQLPDRVIYRTGVTAGVNVPPNNDHVVSTASQRMSALAAVGPTGAFVPGEIIGMTPHAHQIASVMTSDITQGGQKTCLINVPKWDFNWQLDYLFPKGVTYSANDTVTATCVYDNSAQHQPTVDGVMQQPRLVTFGEGSLDEMCLHYVWLRMDRKAFLGH